MKEKVLFFGGSFNPVHTGHLLLAQICAEYLNIKRVVFIPTGKPPHKELEIDPIHRLKMLKLAIEDDTDFEISTYEISKEQMSYTYETIGYLEKEFNCLVYFFVGGDSLEDIHKWKEPQKILSQCFLVYGKRHGFGHNMKAHLEKHQLPLEKIIEVPTPIIEISSTEIRRRVKSGKSIKYYVPKKVETYIQQKKLYI